MTNFDVLVAYLPQKVFVFIIDAFISFFLLFSIQISLDTTQISKLQRLSN